ncbi:MAG: non-homologous end-joining DNA ligase [Desulforhopalus sp.]
MIVKAGRRSIEISHPDKVLFPEAGLTKQDLVSYYKRIAEWMLPYIRKRALTLERCVDGLEGDCFMQQEAKDFFPDYVGRKMLARKDGSDLEHVTCDNVAALVYLANLGVVTFHRWFSRVGNANFPDRMVFDLDPAGDDFAPVVHGAFLLREILEDIGLVPFAMTTGSRGIHVVVPVDRQKDFDAIRSLAMDIASLLTAHHPEVLTTEQRRNKRKGRLYLDVLRNAYGQTGVAPYAVRAKETAPVATPLDWQELNDTQLHAKKYTISNIFRRLGQKEDPWKGMARRSRSLQGPKKRLDRLCKNAG